MRVLIDLIEPFQQFFNAADIQDDQIVVESHHVQGKDIVIDVFTLKKISQNVQNYAFDQFSPQRLGSFRHEQRVINCCRGCPLFGGDFETVVGITHPLQQELNVLPVGYFLYELEVEH
jgi:hypothetical protein